MKDFNFFQEAPENTLKFLTKLDVNNDFNFQMTQTGNTRIGTKLNLGFLCYVLKIYKMTNHWDTLNEATQQKLKLKIAQYQNNKDPYRGYFIDTNMYKYLFGYVNEFQIKEIVKKASATLLKNNIEPKKVKIQKIINAEHKQAISTLKEVGYDDFKHSKLDLYGYSSAADFLDSFDWSKPWDAGAQFSSFCVYSNIIKEPTKTELLNFISKKVDVETGSYFENNIKDPRQIINGAMKVISGLDWLDAEIHSPEKLIDFCLSNVPKFEGCDLVDYVYVLYKCSQHTNYKKAQIATVLLEILNVIKMLYYPNENGFSYFLNKSQTMYYSVRVSVQKKQADLHGTILSVWAIIMILEILEENNKDYQLIKP